MKTENINFARIQKLVQYLAFAFMTYLLAALCQKVYGCSVSDDMTKTRPTHPRCVAYSENLYGVCKKTDRHPADRNEPRNMGQEVLLKTSLQSHQWDMNSKPSYTQRTVLYHSRELSNGRDSFSNDRTITSEPIPLKFVILNF